MHDESQPKCGGAGPNNTAGGNSQCQNGALNTAMIHRGACNRQGCRPGACDRNENREDNEYIVNFRHDHANPNKTFARSISDNDDTQGLARRKTCEVRCPNTSVLARW